MSSPELSRPGWAVAPAPATTNDWGPPELNVRSAAGDAAPAPDPLLLAREEGFHEGFAEGRAQARRDLAPVEDALRRLIGELEREMGTARQRAETNLYALSLAVARWLMHREVEADPTVMEHLIRRAVSLLPAGVPVEIHAGASQVEQLTNTMTFSEPDGRPIPVHWVADPELEPGSFRLVSPERLIDGRTDVALRSLYDRLAGD